MVKKGKQGLPSGNNSNKLTINLMLTASNEKTFQEDSLATVMGGEADRGNFLPEYSEEY